MSEHAVLESRLPLQKGCNQALVEEHVLHETERGADAATDGPSDDVDGREKLHGLVHVGDELANPACLLSFHAETVAQRKFPSQGEAKPADVSKCYLFSLAPRD